MNYNKAISDTKIRLGEVRFSYANVFEPRTAPGSTDAKYSCVLLIPKTDKATMDILNSAIDAATAEGKSSKWNGRVPAKLNLPIHDGDTEREDDTYAGHWFINANAGAKYKPAVKILADGQMFDALDSEDFYSGCYGVAVVNLYPYAAAGNNGIGVGLNIVMKTRDGDKLSGGVSAEEAMADLLG